MFFRWYKSEFLWCTFNDELTRMDLLLRKNRPHVRGAVNALSKKLDLPEVISEKSLELVEIEFMHMKWVVEMRLIRIQHLIGSGDQKNSIRRQKSLGFAQQLLMIVNVLESLETNDDVKDAVTLNRDLQY